MSRTTVAAVISSRIVAMMNCERSGNDEWRTKHWEDIQQIANDFLPSGSGWDLGTKIDGSKTRADKLVFFGEYHHMDEWGGYDGWTEHTITVTPTFGGIYVSVSGRNRNDIKDYLEDLFHSSLSQEIEWDAERERYVSARTNTCRL